MRPKVGCRHTRQALSLPDVSHVSGDSHVPSAGGKIAASFSSSRLHFGFCMDFCFRRKSFSGVGSERLPAKPE